MTNKITKTSDKTSHLKDLLLLFAIPISIAVFAAMVIYLPNLLTNPKYDFIYMSCSDYYCQDGYTVDSAGHVTLSTNSSNNSYYRSTSSLRYYDSKNDSTKSLTLDEAYRYRLNTSSKSPDGYTLSRESSSKGFLFWGNYDDGQYLKKGAKKKKVLLSNNSSYSRDVEFLGWVIK